MSDEYIHHVSIIQFFFLFCDCVHLQRLPTTLYMVLISLVALDIALFGIEPRALLHGAGHTPEASRDIIRRLGGSIIL